ncbi:RNA polymerase recycling motor HelD [Paenibacillus sp. NEAU-GSW1]|uniref:RNA polymerase recycling motor HelD n=1 Tax=Paenibacillus sp. NEAU-GSW1 TaxID=2682486 RepID=UPI0012E22B33|nr:RNA polymerase recycling motor HelD [Paenibacillus sp. NEAU-GSW1]MUT68314.1 AAA family ATPase [Paenibacillus sp. NEAU-GSW1]
MISANDWKQEQEWLDKVTEQLQLRIAKLEPEVSGLRNQVTDIRKRFWEEVTVNTNTDEDFEETFHSIRQQEALLNERERSHRLRVQQFRNMKRLLPTPFFGRIDFEEEGMGVRERIYIGVSSFADEEGMDFLVYDWRTPIASMYYDYSPGPVSYQTHVGPVNGEMLLKRQYQIRDGQLRNVFDTSVTIGDELLQEVLGKGSDSQMKSIVATIQKEQNTIIRDTKSQMLIVQGAAGSGKTSAALQRAAFLLYKYRDRLTADQIVLFSPNPMFNSYVSTVLPELGEENMQQTTFQEYLALWLGSTMQLEDPFDQLEYVLTAEPSEQYEARLQGIRYKASEDFLQALQGYALWLCGEGMKFNAICFMDRELISPAQMEKQFYSYDSSIRLENRVSLLREWLLRQLSALERKERDADWAQDEIEYLDDEQYDEAYRTLLNKYQREDAVFDDVTQLYVKVHKSLPTQNTGEENVFDFAGQEEELLRRMIVKERFEPLRKAVKRFKFIDVIGLYRQLFGDVAEYRRMTGGAEAPGRWAEICRQTKAKLEQQELFNEDATPFLYVKELVEGARKNTDVRHVFVDEGQDYSPFQYAFLKRLFPRARMTVLGDFGQAIFTQATNLHGADSSLIRLYGEEETNLIRLVRSYRSTQEIVRFTRLMLPGGEEIVPFERSGGKPRLIQLQSGEERASRIAQDVAMLRAEGFDSIAVITKTSTESREAYEALTAEGCEGLRLITKETITFEKGVAVIPSYLAKGVEFDAVLVYDTSSRTYSRESERKLFYTVCTRAMHRLKLYAIGEMSPFVRDLDEDLYGVE